LQGPRQHNVARSKQCLKAYAASAVHRFVGSIAPVLQLAVNEDSRLPNTVAELRQRLTERIAARALELPLLPDVAAQVIALSTSDESDARELAEVIRRDGPMSAHILRLANSPLFRPRTPIVSLQQALSRLGMTQIRQIAFAVSCKQRVFRARGYEPEVRVSFRHSFAAGLAAQELARARRWNVEEAFLAGLLHDVGRPVLLQAIVDMHGNNRMLNRQAVLTVVAELHAQVGGMLAQKWSLPARVAEAIAFHHDPHAAKLAPQLSILISFADDIPACDEEQTPDAAAALLKHPLLPHLNLYPDEVTAIIARRKDFAETLQAVA
jgi:putative nucleotidyltransferase with HDIG domain